MKIECECLIDINTGKHLVIEISDSYNNYMENIAPLKQAAYESGVRFRTGLGLNDKDDK